MKVSKLTAIVFSTLALTCNEPSKKPSSHSSILNNLITGYKHSHLIKNKELTKEGFLKLIKSVNTHEKLANLIIDRGIYYPDEGLERKIAIQDLSYSAPLETHNRLYGVCDELSLYVIPFLLQMENVNQITLMECQGDFENNNDTEKNAIHSFVVFKENDRWRYYNNLKLSKKSFSFKSEAAENAARDTGFTLSKIEYKEREINQLGSWIYTDITSIKMKPKDNLISYCSFISSQ